MIIDKYLSKFDLYLQKKLFETNFISTVLPAVWSLQIMKIPFHRSTFLFYWHFVWIILQSSSSSHKIVMQNSVDFFFAVRLGQLLISNWIAGDLFAIKLTWYHCLLGLAKIKTVKKNTTKPKQNRHAPKPDLLEPHQFKIFVISVHLTAFECEVYLTMNDIKCGLDMLYLASTSRRTGVCNYSAGIHLTLKSCKIYG